MKTIRWAVTLFLCAAAAIAVFEALADHRTKNIRFSVTRTADLQNPPKAHLFPARLSETITRNASAQRTLLDQCESFEFSETFDQFGLRAAASHTTFIDGPSIVLVGDSFTFGSEVEFPNTLQGHLAKALPNANVVNFGKTGSSSVYFSETFRHLTNQTGILTDILVVGLFTDMEIGDIPRALAAEKYGPRVVFKGAPMSEAKRLELVRSQLAYVKFEIELFLRRWSSTYNVLFPPKTSPQFAISLKSRLNEKNFSDYIGRLLKYLAALTSTSGIPPDRTIIWLVPSNRDLFNRFHAIRGTVARDEFQDLSLAFWRKASDDLRKQGFVVVDEMAEIQSLYLKGGHNPYSCSGHFRPVAYEHIAIRVLRRVRELLSDANS